MHFSIGAMEHNLYIEGWVGDKKRDKSSANMAHVPWRCLEPNYESTMQATINYIYTTINKVKVRRFPKGEIEC